MFSLKKTNKYNTFDYEKKYKKNKKDENSSNIIHISKKYKTSILLQLSLKFI